MSPITPSHWFAIYNRLFRHLARNKAHCCSERQAGITDGNSLLRALTSCRIRSTGWRVALCTKQGKHAGVTDCVCSTWVRVATSFPPPRVLEMHLPSSPPLKMPSCLTDPNTADNTAEGAALAFQQVSAGDLRKVSRNRPNLSISMNITCTRTRTRGHAERHLHLISPLSLSLSLRLRKTGFDSK